MSRPHSHSFAMRAAGRPVEVHAHAEPILIRHYGETVAAYVRSSDAPKTLLAMANATSLASSKEPNVSKCRTGDSLIRRADLLTKSLRIFGLAPSPITAKRRSKPCRLFFGRWPIWMDENRGFYERRGASLSGH